MWKITIEEIIGMLYDISLITYLEENGIWIF